MKYTIDIQEEYAVLSVHEDKIDSGLSPSLKTEMLTQHAKGTSRLVLNLSDVKYMDSSGLSALLVGNRIFRQEGGALVITGISDHIMKLIKISQLETMLHIVPTVAEAVEQVKENT